MRRRRTAHAVVVALAVLSGALLVPGAAPGALRVGIADQDPRMFVDPLFTAFEVKTTRLVVPHDEVDDPSSAGYQRTATFIARAAQQGIEVLIAFNHTRGFSSLDGTCRRTTLPSVARYTAQFKRFRAAFPSVTAYQPWNEVNSPTQPTCKDPERVARFTDAVVKHCRGCKVVGVDLQDISNMSRWFRAFHRSLKSRSKIRYWGLHNYSDANRGRTKGTREFLRITRRGEVWLTETGGLHSLCSAGATCSFPPDAARQASAIDHLFQTVVKVDRRRITRLYLYELYGAPGPNARFDAGLLTADGARRPAYDAVAGYLR